MSSDMQEEAAAVISLQFDCPNELPHTVNIAGIPETDPNFVDPEAETSNLSWKYSGRHDHGTLPSLQVEGKPMLTVVSSLLQAKKESDVYLTTLIEKEEKERREAAALNGEPIEEEPSQGGSKKKGKKQSKGNQQHSKGKKKQVEQENEKDDDNEGGGEKESETIFTSVDTEGRSPEKKARVEEEEEMFC